MKDLSRFGPFALEGKLGDVATSTVYRAVHVEQSRMVAVKLFDAPLAAKNAAAKRALVQEIDALKKMKHWNIASCYGGILKEMQGCIAYEFVEGETIQELLARRDRLAWEQVVEYGYQITAALQVAHEQEVIHQDLQPSKILIAEDGTVKVTDFRVDRLHNPWCASSSRLTLDRAPYRAPEQFISEQKLTRKTDLYALGCILFEMVVGHPPFTGDSIEDIARQHRDVEAPRVDGLVFECPVWLSTTIGQLLEKDPANRPHGAGAVSLALSETTRQVAAKASTIAHAAGGFSALQPHAEKDAARELLKQTHGRKRKSKKEKDGPPFYERAWFLALCLVVMIGGIGTWLAWPPSEAGLLRRAVAIIEAKEGVARESARPHLNKLLRLYPNGEYSDAAEEHLQTLDMDSARRKFEFNIKLGREPKSESERLYKEAWDFEQFGDRMAALDKYRGMVDVLADEKDTVQLAFVNLARRKVAEIETEGSDDDRIEYIESRLQDADQLADEGKAIDAKKIWRGIIELYGNKPEFKALVARAENKLHPPAETETES